MQFYFTYEPRDSVMTDWFEELNKNGFAVLSGVFTGEEMHAAQEEFAAAFADASASRSVLAARDGSAYGARNLLQIWPGVVRLMQKPSLREPLLQILGPEGGLVRGLYFDKPPGHSWALPWHRDLTIAVKEHGALGIFKKPTKKAGVPHVEAPVQLLESMVTARIHLDDVTDKNGPLRVIPGSHLLEKNDSSGEKEQAVLTCRAGDVLLMRPLLLHSSGHSEEEHAGHRRIIHLEFTPSPKLPDGYEWHDFFSLATDKHR